MAVVRTKLVPEVYDLGALWLYREDLQAIATAVNELGALKITCSSGNSTFEASEPSDFEQLPEDLQTLTISTARSVGPSTVSVTFNREVASVELEEPNTQAAGVLSRIKDICEPLHRSGWFFLRRLGRPLAAVSFIFLIGTLIGYANSEKSSVWHNQFMYNGLPLLFIFLTVSGLAMAFITGVSRRVVISNAQRSSRPRYWQRTGDMWVVGVITALIGAIIGYVLGLIS